MKTAALNKSRVLGLAVMVASLVFLVPAIANGAGRYVVIDLGVLQEGEGSCALGVNNAGQVVGFGIVREPGGTAYPRAFVWADGTMVELGTLAGDQASVARRINERGYIAGWSEQVGVRTRAVFWRPGWGGWFIHNLRTLGGTSCAALDINDTDWIVGWSDITGNLCRHGVKWIHGLGFGLGAPAGETNSFAHAINRAGQIVGMASTGGTNPSARAIVWEWGLPMYIMPGNARNCADDINDSGLVVGYYTVTNSAGPTRRACIWDLLNQTTTDLGVLPGDNASRAVAINAHGKVVGLSWLAPDPFADPPFGLPETADFHPFVFDPANGTISNLNDLIPANSGYMLNWVGDINDRGWIAGAALVEIGGAQKPRAVLLVPDPTVTRDPTNQQAQLGGTASFTVEAVGTAPLTYQWWKDGAPVEHGTNSTLTLTNLQAADAGYYFVVVTNQYGSATSAVALLTVNLVELDPAFSPHIEGDVYALAVQPDGKIVVGGRFNFVAGYPCTNLARLNPDGTIDPSFDVRMLRYTADGYDTYVKALVIQPDGKIVIGGYFDSIAGQTRTNLARVLVDGALDPDFTPHLVGESTWDAGLESMALQPDGKILVGGSFIQVAGVPRTNIVRLNPDGSVDPEFSPVVEGRVCSLALQADGKIVIGGDFHLVNGQYRSVVARLNADGSLDTSFAPEIVGGEWPMVDAVLVQDDGKILVGGLFRAVNGVPRTNVARLNPDGSVDTGFVVNTPEGSVAFAQQADGKVLVAGDIFSVNGVRRTGIVRVDRAGSVDPTFGPEIELFESGRPFVIALAVQADGKIIIGGGFEVVNGQIRTNIARLTNTGPAVESLVVDRSGILWVRTGTCPEVWRTTFEFSRDGQEWYMLGPGTRIANGWRLDEVQSPAGGMLRARGYLTGGTQNGSSWFVEARAVPVLPIRLRIELIGSRVLLSWTGGRPPFQVQKAYELVRPVFWTDVGEPVWTNAVVLPVEQSNVFFRVYGQ